jgi:hypothetical protein
MCHPAAKISVSRAFHQCQTSHGSLQWPALVQKLCYRNTALTGESLTTTERVLLTYHFILRHNTKLHECSYRLQLPLLLLSFLHSSSQSRYWMSGNSLCPAYHSLNNYGAQNKNRRNWFSLKVTLMKMHRSRNSVVSIVSRLRAGCPNSRGSLPVKWKISSVKRVYRPRDSLSLLLNGCRKHTPVAYRRGGGPKVRILTKLSRIPSSMENTSVTT